MTVCHWGDGPRGSGGDGATGRGHDGGPCTATAILAVTLPPLSTRRGKVTASPGYPSRGGSGSHVTWSTGLTRTSTYPSARAASPGSGGGQIPGSPAPAPSARGSHG